MTRAASFEVTGPDVLLRPCPAGPVLVRGAREVRDDDGNEWLVRRPVVAVCRCRRSGRLPWCDSSHQLPQQSGEPSAEHGPGP